MDARPDILNHNLETVRRLQKPVRKRARWDRSLYVLRAGEGDVAVEIGYAAHTKSSLMVGLGETRDELTEAFEALRAVDVDILTIGQYLRPSEQAPAARALLPPRRVRRDEGRGPRARVQARRVGAARAIQLPRPRPGPGRRARRSVAVRRRSTPTAGSCRLPARVDSLERTFYAVATMRAEYREEPCRSALNKVSGMSFKWSLNPYTGCVHRCTFCFVRAFEKRADRPFDDRYGTSIRVKTNLVEVLRKELGRPPGVTSRSSSGPRPIRTSRPKADTG